MSGMFDRTLRELDRLKHGMTISLPVPADEKGYVDKECPNQECLYVFKVSEADWRELFKDEEVFCPRCGHSAPATSWFTTQQVEHARDVGIAQIEARLGSALQSDARAFNSRQPRGGLVRMSMSYSGSTSAGFVLPAKAREVLEQELSCENCGAHFAVLGCAFFCPCCGHNSVERTFNDALRKVLANLDGLGLVRAALRDAGLDDEAEMTCTTLIESSLQDCVTAFQTLCTGVFSRLAPEVSLPRNVFQRLDDGSALWKTTFGAGYQNVLDVAELSRFSLYLQRRHLLAHNSGLVDDTYVSKTSDLRWRVGQRIVIAPDDVRDCVAIIRKLTDGLRSQVASRQVLEGPKI